MNREALEAAFGRAQTRAEAAPARVERRVQPMVAADVPSFAEAPLIRPEDAAGWDAVILGVPYEGYVLKDPRTFLPRNTGPEPGSEPYCRPGADQGPRGIRQGSTFFSLDHSGGLLLDRGGVTIRDTLRVADAGDVDVEGQTAEEIVGWLPELVAEIARAGAVPLLMGGEHIVPAFALDGLFRAHGRKIGVISYDAHLDLSWEPRYWDGSEWARAMEVGALDPRNLVQIGIRGLRNSQFWSAAADELGVRYYTMPEVDALGLEEVSRRALEQAMDGCDLLYVTVDTDAFDPSAVPAQRFPEPGGFSVRELLGSLRQVLGDGSYLAGFDFCDFGPQYDHQWHGCAAAARCFVEVLGALAEGKAARAG
jgi:arginase family enzyme